MTATFEVTAGRLKCLKKRRKKRIDQSSMKDFWSEIGSGSRRGVYIFGIRAAQGWKPLYVGQTKAKNQNFRKRMYHHMHVGDFDRMLKDIKKGTPWLFLIGRVGQGKLSNSVINALEIEFINYAFARNKNLHNDRGIQRPNFVVQGFGRGGGKRFEVRELKRMIGW